MPGRSDAAPDVRMASSGDAGSARGVPRPLSVAPMLDWTDRHFRRFLRGLTRRTLLYTEMVTAAAVLHGDRERLLGFCGCERPVSVQLAGDDPDALARAAAIAVAFGYDEVGLNVGCPSERVQRGRFGACLMAEPDRVAAIVGAMRAAVDVPVTVKHRLGIDHLDDDDHLHAFVAALAGAGVDRVVVHARKAWLRGLSPKENRTVPPLQPDRVLALKAAFPSLRVEYNGGVRTLDEASVWLARLDGVMIGRAAIEDPYLLADADARVFGELGCAPSRAEAIAAYLPHVEAERARGVSWIALIRPLLPLARGLPGGRTWRRVLSEGATRSDAGPERILAALRALPPEARDARGRAAAPIPAPEAAVRLVECRA